MFGVLECGGRYYTLTNPSETPQYVPSSLNPIVPWRARQPLVTEITSNSFLALGTVDPKLDFFDILQISKA